MVDNLILGLTAALQLKQFMFMVLGTVIGLWVGVLPGLGGPVAMAILIPFTFSMDPLSALLMLASISVGAAFGGSVTSILLNIPGEASSAATAYDGYPMAQRGKAKVAMGLSAGASMAAAIAGVLILMFASGPVAKAALAFSRRNILRSPSWVSPWCRSPRWDPPSRDWRWGRWGLRSA